MLIIFCFENILLLLEYNAINYKSNEWRDLFARSFIMECMYIYLEQARWIKTIAYIKQLST